ncbi:hypothetical protein [Corynebacterium kalidii]|uniref:Serine hydrolase n=1 Tax=Corynebacterium kalidii TaxID=2931982 RepID=A0A9X2AZI1_9CORY|nr:hypothetical protein [Corynebacterium kalidii]MCJ7858853.1 hypothetical protein [Corynebacterium kalidii]
MAVVRRRTTGTHHRAAETQTNPLSLWVVGGLLLAILSAAVFLNGLSADDGDEAERRQRALEQDVAASSAPTAEQEAESIRVALAAVTDEIGAEFGVTTGATMRAGGGIVHVGELQEARALSSVKVPVSIAAVQKSLRDGRPVEDLVPDIDRAITVSDNDAALRLWQTLGDDDEADAAELGAVLGQGGDPTDTTVDWSRDDYEGFGDIVWTLDHQAIFANQMACVLGSGQVLDAMGRLSDEHRTGLGQLEGARVKGGWGDTADGSFILREFGLVGPVGAQVPVAVAVIPEDGQEETARAAVSEMARRIAPLVDEASANGGAAECQVG